MVSGTRSVMEHKKRVQRLQKILGVRAALVSDPDDVFYYTGFQADVGDCPLLLVKGQGRPLLFLSPLTGHLKLNADVVPLTKTTDLTKRLPKTLGIDEHHLPVKLYKEISKKRKLVFSSSKIKRVREVKDREEIELMKQAIRLDKKAFTRLNLFGRTEKNIAEELDLFFHKSKASPAFETIIASGRNAGNYIHHFPGEKKVSRSETVIIDLGSRVGGYCSDITRTYFLKTNTKQRRLFEDVLELQERCIEMVEPGVELEGIDDLYKKELKRKGHTPMHGIGHGLGISVHEPVGELKVGMVITIEPGIYLKNFGGCRLEDMVLVTKNSHKVLSRSIGLL